MRMCRPRQRAIFWFDLALVVIRLHGSLKSEQRSLRVINLPRSPMPSRAGLNVSSPLLEV
jgi:hypothetical protein